MAFFIQNIEKTTKENKNYRKVIYTAPVKNNKTENSKKSTFQLVLMSLNPQEEIGLEVHPNTTQFFRVESGRGKVIAGDKEYKIRSDSIVIIPAGVKHNVINSSKVRDLKLYTIYTPAEHKPRTVQKNKPKYSIV